MKKQILTIIFALSALTACQSQEAAEDTSKEVIEKSKTDNQIDYKLGENLSIGNFDLTINDYKLVKDTDGDDALVLDYNWKNNSDFITNPYYSLKLDGFQEGKMTKEVFTIDGIDFQTEKQEYKPGEEVENGKATVAITDIKKPLELQITNLYDPGEAPTTFTVENLEQYR